jgi:hypothetical protein
MLTDEKIEKLIAVPKKIIQAPKKKFWEDKTNHFCLHNNFICASLQNEKDIFLIFLRKHISIPESFSIGMNYTNEKTLLIRVNGKHYHSNKENTLTFNDFHVHTSNELQLNKGITNSFDANICKEYSNFNSALLFFCKTCGIMDINKYLPNMFQMSMEELL